MEEDRELSSEVVVVVRAAPPWLCPSVTMMAESILTHTKDRQNAKSFLLRYVIIVVAQWIQTKNETPDSSWARRSTRETAVFQRSDLRSSPAIVAMRHMIGLLRETRQISQCG